ncbi:hypothetical protein PCANC_10567 [Puccinia coronata f. sp. avenae]|uniref:Uncharacterized protein n=1 Tax=Puccinia coronata f. sp. avenae TaxID=200324 RepID=A0A2N5VZ80_9BASI|nr:hypothetical protein PCANC_10567 [Puccinia coronata f. sp. avenae]
MISSPDAERTSAVAVDHTRTRTVVQHECYNGSKSQTESNNEIESVTLGSTDTIKTASDSGSDFPVESDVEGGLVTLGSKDTIDTNKEEGAESSMEEYELVASYEEQPINEEEVDELDSEFEIEVKNEVANS